MQERVLLCGEGPTDYGNPEYGTNRWEEGPVQPIIRKTAGKPFIFEHVEKKELKRLRIQRGPQGGHAVKAYKLSVIAKKRKIDRVICYVDADKLSGKGNKEAVAKESFRRVYSDIKNGFNDFNERFGSRNGKKIHGIPMVPLRMIESWLLSDGNAFYKCFGTYPSSPPLPHKPELIWGDKDDPESNYPKNLMNRVLKQYYKKNSREVFNEIAKTIAIDMLRERCPLSFEPFYINLR